MRLLNLACGATRPPEPWTNCDTLYQVLPRGTIERAQLDAESNYIEADIRNPLPFTHETFDGVLASHIFEHCDAQFLRSVIVECWRVLKHGGILMASVPDASYHRSVFSMDNKTHALELFGEVIPESEAKQSFLDYGLFFVAHMQVFTEDSLWCSLVNGSFSPNGIQRYDAKEYSGTNTVVKELHALLNRRKFSLVMAGVKE